MIAFGVAAAPLCDDFTTKGINCTHYQNQKQHRKERPKESAIAMGLYCVFLQCSPFLFLFGKEVSPVF